VPPVAGAGAAVPEGVPPCGTGVSGTGLAGAAAPGGAAAGAGEFDNDPSSTERGTRVRVDMICIMNARARKIPAHHHVDLVRRFPAWWMPIKASGEELAPPKFAASPVPFPACNNIVAMRRTESRTRRTTRKLYSIYLRE
jgi:hypothetical protein